MEAWSRGVQAGQDRLLYTYRWGRFPSADTWPVGNRPHAVQGSPRDHGCLTGGSHQNASTSSLSRSLPRLPPAKSSSGLPASSRNSSKNSIDAGSTRIDIDVEQGGAELVRVVDDGHGFRPDDLCLAFANHATSKLETADDLFSVHTLGFRGEALASIGGIAQVTLQSSRPADMDEGAELPAGAESWRPSAPGTALRAPRIEVRQLFFNTPRCDRKFLRTPGTEMGHICEMLTRAALARPGLHLHPCAITAMKYMKSRPKPVCSTASACSLAPR